MDIQFDIIKKNNKRLYINKNFRNAAFEQALLNGQEYLLKHFEFTSIPSSHFSRVYKLNVRFNNLDTCVYMKEHLSRGIRDFLKNIIRPGRAKRAFDASLMLQDSGFDAPIVIAFLEGQTGRFGINEVMITREVESAKPILKFLKDSYVINIDALHKRRSLLAGFGKTVGKMHSEGICHGDLRANNVMTVGEKNNLRFFFLDNERTRKFNRLPERLRVKNLVQLQLSSIETFSNTDQMRFLKIYLAENKMIRAEGKKLAQKVLKKTEQRLHKRTEIIRRPNKYLQTNERFLHFEGNGYYAVFDRRFCDNAQPIDLIEKLDALMDNGKIIKCDVTTYLSHVSWNNKEVVIKRYNHKGFIHSLRHSVLISRARRSWLNAHLLQMLNIPTPKPLAFIEIYKGPILWQSYLITEFVEGIKLYYFLQTANDEARLKIALHIRELLDKLGENRIIHGDLKLSNIIVSKAGLVLTDLDSMKRHRWKWIYSLRKSKDTQNPRLKKFLV
jgi:tRNA A-37 threonylcarbamoyl transferase component Bud32